MKVTIKLIRVKVAEIIYPDTKCESGGMDLTQLYLFKHLIPDGYCYQHDSDMLFDLIRAHGWDYRIRDVDLLDKE